jgi:hypothetical protein
MTDEEMLELIRSGAHGRERVARYLYTDTRLRRGVAKVMGHGASSDSDFWNIFHTMILQFFKYVLKNSEFSLINNYRSYLIKAARNIWYMELRKRNNKLADLPENYDVPDTGEIAIDIQLENSERRHAIMELLSQFGQTCKEVLLGWAQGKKMQDMQV